MSTISQHVTPPLGAPRRAQRALAAALSTVLHVGAFLLLATTSVHIVTPERAIIPLVIRAPPPPPPPAGPGIAEGTSATAPPPVKPVPPVVQIQPKPVPPVKVEKTKIAAQRPPKTKPLPPSPAAEPPPVAAAPAAPAPEVRAGGGVEGGVVGGKASGKIGGRVGGTGNDVYTIDEVAVPPKLVQSVVPDYPTVARVRGQQGVVVLQAIIDRSGAVEEENVTVLQSEKTFDDAAVKAFRQWRFSPGRNHEGEAVRVIVRQSVRFQLR